MNKYLSKIFNLIIDKMDEMVGKEYVITWDLENLTVDIELNLACTIAETNSLALYLESHIEKVMGEKVVSTIDKTPKYFTLEIKDLKS